jgi:hypothetical protein
LNIPLESRHRTCLLAVLALALGACNGARIPLQITNVSSTPDPIVGQTVSLKVEVASTVDEDFVTLQIYLPEGVRLVNGDLAWRGSLIANVPMTHQVEVCTLLEGDWAVVIIASSTRLDGDNYYDSETIHFISTIQSGKAIPGREYRPTVPPAGFGPSTPFPTPYPGTCS